MCLVKFHKFPKRAKEDIICFKKLLCDNGSFFTYFMGEPITSPIQKGKVIKYRNLSGYLNLYLLNILQMDSFMCTLIDVRI